MSFHRVVVVGGGVSGLAATYYLSKHGIDTLLIEKESRTGGLIRTDRLENCLLEAGADSFLAAKPAVNELAAEMEGLGRQVITSNDAARRVFIVRRGKLVPFPSGMSMMVPGELLPALRSGLFNLNTKLRFLSEPFARPRQRPGDVSVGQLVCDHFGPQLLEYVADPLLAGVYGGSAASLSARSVLPRFVEYEERFGSLMRAVKQENRRAAKGPLFRSFAGGMQELTNALTAAIPPAAILTEAAVSSVTRDAAHRWRIALADRSLEAEYLILACPAHAAARLLQSVTPALATDLEAIPYSSAILVTFLYDADRVDHPLDGFGFLVPQRERHAVAAATWINRKFPTRIAPGLVAIRAFVVGEEAVRLGDASNQELEQLVAKDLQRIMGLAASPRTTLVQRWPVSMPQYVVGHEERLHRIREQVSKLPHLHLIGNAYEGVGIPDCVRLAKLAAERVREDIKSV